MRRIILIAIFIVIMSPGCSEIELRRVDELVQDVNTIAQGGQAVLESPAGQMIPPQVKIFGLLGVMLANGLVITWEEWRNRTMKKTTKAIVRGIEDTTNPDKATSEVKGNIREAMLREGGEKFYDRANKIVDKLKIE